jgi:hypothetical protein
MTYEGRATLATELAPVALFKAPAVPVLFPVMGNPLVAVPLADPVALHPNVMLVVPAVIARGPHVTGARRRNDLDYIWRRGDVNLYHAGGVTRYRDGCCAYR